MPRTNLSRLVVAASISLLVLNCSHTARAADETHKSAATGITDAEIRDVITRVARHQIHPLNDGEYPEVKSIETARAAKAPEGIAWSYPWGVTLYGAQRSVDVTGDKDVEKFVLEHNAIIARYYTWLMSVEARLTNNAEWGAFRRDRNRIKVAGLINLGNLDSCGAMGVQFLESMLRHPEQVTDGHKAVAARIANYIATKQQRLPDGTFWRPGATDTSKQWKPGTLWIDDLYMGCPYLVRWSKFTGDGKYLTDAAKNVINMAKRMQDKDGVWFHAYDVPQEEHSPFKWGRANGWAMVATVEILSEMPKDHPERAALLDVLKRHIDGLKPLQAPDGMWRQVLDKPELWEETSCSAMFAYSIARAVNRGWIDKSYLPMARRAFEGISKNVTAEGVVNETCEGTNIGLNLDYYAKRGRPSDDLHGRGVVLLAGTEILLGGKK